MSLGMTTLETPSTDLADAFGARMVGIVNDAAIALLCSIGHQTGLFDTLAELPPATSAQIADSAGLNERYVREWLGAMLTSEIIDYDPAARTYRLPPEHAASLIRASGPGNMASWPIHGAHGIRRGQGRRLVPQRRRCAVL